MFGMYDQSRKEQFIRNLINNTNYYSKEIAIKHITAFLNQHN
jgi:hypothetical protein